MKNFKKLMLTGFLSLNYVFNIQSAKAEGFDMPECPTTPPTYSQLLALAEPSNEFECLGTPEKLLKDEDVREFYLGLNAEGTKRKSFKDVKHYKRKKRWLS